MQIRCENVHDAAAIRDLVYSAFKGHIHHPPGTEPTEHQLVDKLRDDAALTLSLVAQDDGDLVGHVAFSAVQIDGKNLNWFGLGPLSVRPAFQNRGIGSALMRHGIAMMRDQGAGGIVLLGDPQYYTRFGFRPESALVLPDLPAEYFLALPLQGDVPAGRVTYHDAFY